jgi:hypothetical protein
MNVLSDSKMDGEAQAEWIRNQEQSISALWAKRAKDAV